MCCLISWMVSSFPITSRPPRPKCLLSEIKNLLVFFFLCARVFWEDCRGGRRGRGEGPARGKGGRSLQLQKLQLGESNFLTRELVSCSGSYKHTEHLEAESLSQPDVSTTGCPCPAVPTPSALTPPLGSAQLQPSHIIHPPDHFHSQRSAVPASSPARGSREETRRRRQPVGATPPPPLFQKRGQTARIQ